MFIMLATVFATSAETTPANLFRELLPWLIGLLVIVIIGGVVLLLIRRSLNTTESEQPVGFTLHDLRQLHATGQLSDEEFDRARDAMIGRFRSAEAADDADAGQTTDADSRADAQNRDPDN